MITRPQRSDGFGSAPWTQAGAGRGAFSLIELLVVIAIIVLLVAILLPALRSARETAKTNLCLSNQKQLAIAFHTYADDFRERFVGAYTNLDTHPESWVDYPRTGAGVIMSEPQLRAASNVDAQIEACKRGRLYEYSSDYRVFHCPSDVRSVFKPNANTALAFVTYSIPNYLNGDTAYDLTVGGRKIFRRMSELWRPSDNYAFVEESDPRGLNINSWVLYLNQNRWIDPLTVWHFDQGNIAYADGHAEQHRWLDRRTIRMSRDQVFAADATNNADFTYLRSRWGVGR